MSITKKARAALLVMLFSISILPGCGKNKNDQPGIGVGIAPVGVGIAVNGTGGCFNVYGTSTAVTLAFAGTNQSMSAGNFYGNLSPASVGGINQFVRTNVFGDVVYMGSSGSTMVATVTLSSQTVLAANAYGGQVCGLSVNAIGYSTTQSGSGYSGTLGGPISLRVGNSYMAL